MSSRSVSSFLASFVRPLVAGGDLEVGEPIDAETMRAFVDELPHASTELVAVDEAREVVLSELVVRPPALVMDAEELHLAASVHNLLFLVHPRSGGKPASRGRLQKVVEAAQVFAARPLRHDRRRILARHALLHNLFDLARNDTRVSWWTGSSTFLGQAPPDRLMAWPSLRRVRTNVEVTGFHELFASPAAMPVVTSLLRRSPMTMVLGPPGVAPPVRWEDAVFLLRDAEMARAIAYFALDPSNIQRRGTRANSESLAGVHDDDFAATVAAPARFAAGFEQMLERNPEEADLRAVAAFLVHLSVLLALGETRRGNLDAPSALLNAVLAAERAGQRPRGLATFFALPDALALVAPELCQPPGLEDEPRLLCRWQQHRRQIAAGIGKAVIETLAMRIGRRIGRSLAAAPDSSDSAGSLGAGLTTGAGESPISQPSSGADPLEHGDNNG